MITRSLSLYTFLALLSPVPAAFAADAGSVIFATGSVTAERQPAEALKKGDAVMPSDTVVTGDASRAQLLMVDGAKIALRPDSRLRIDEYAFPEPTAGATVTSTDNSSVMTLVKGGFRSITGAIGKNDPSDYEVRTPVGVLGIRGTDYSAVFCNGDCDWVPGVSPTAPIEDGLYLGVVEGGIRFVSSVATIDVVAGQFVFIPLRSQMPQMLSLPPPVLMDDNDLRMDNGAAGSTDTRQLGFDAKIGTRRSPDSTAAGKGTDVPAKPSREDSKDVVEQPVIAIDPDGQPVDITPGGVPGQNGTRTISYSTGFPSRQFSAYSGANENEPSQLQLDGNNNVLGFDAPVPGASGDETGRFEIGTANNVDTGFDSVTVLRWGRWSGGTADVTLSDGSVNSVDLNNQSLHWISSAQTTPPVLPVTGVASYTLLGGTSPTDNAGNVGVLGSATFFADFTNQLVDSTLGISINGSNWTAAGSGAIGNAADPALAAHLFSGFYGVSIDGVASGNGVFSGFFSEPGDTSDPALPGGVGLTYSLSDGQGATTVSGAAAFGNP
ncbi:MAG TPA: FecR family protein [Woeseiaceae bacterium]|nr:FecR family protein [Woeseiaceae bacterium]